ncbi:MAG: orotidine 5'-phosphate decarboxylase [Candidatus Nezhaarchaeota archaeon]|nr:orotidine 5'-phosphate decarboxylase [Candidatus Nezhaarchaeota archaeon]MCX8141833.1 orotidine 5'-phosphate decarboxylase [Candidatus Nezhaarchaeota archaeon]MDW8050386.1 orotidine 5'-phosphate decarboxylase [Nitrososphaerota archaeon]
MVKGNFVSAVERAAIQNKSRIVLALDIKGSDALNRAERILRDVSSYVCCVKLNKHLILPFGLQRVKAIVELSHELGLPIIADCKLCDIGSTNEVEAELYFEAGFDAITVMPLPGWAEGLEGVFHLAKERGKGILAVVYMSHRGASEFFDVIMYDDELMIFDKLYRVFLRRSLRWHADGFIVGATKPDIIAQLKKEAANRPIFSPGVIAQGGSIVDALRAGASYIIVGRAICESSSPIDKAKELRNLIATSMQYL